MAFPKRCAFRLDTASSSSKRVFSEISNLLGGKYIQRIERSIATSAPENQVRKVRKRVRRVERRAMVESFVHKYRERNLGKFPTPSSAQKEIGGGYYAVKKIIQELEFNSKKSSINTSSPKKELLVNEPSPEVEEVLSSQMTMASLSETEELVSSQMTIASLSETEEVSSSPSIDASLSETQEVSSSPLIDAQLDEDALPVPVNGLDTCDLNKHLTLKEGLQTSMLADNVSSEVVAKPTEAGNGTYYSVTETHLLKGEASQVLDPCPLKPELDMKQKTSEDALDSNGPRLEAKQHEQVELEKLTRVWSQSPKEEEEGKELRKKPSMWDNLKSLANGIISILKKV